MRKQTMPQAPVFNELRNAECFIEEDVRNRFDSSIRIKNLQENGDGSNSISMFGEFGDSFFGDGITAKRIAGALRMINGPVIVNINSPGGNFWEALAIYNLLRNFPHNVTVQVVGMAASAAAIVAMAGDVVKIAQSAFLMIHNSQLALGGDKNAHREAADIMETFDEAIAGIFAARTGMREKKIAEMMDKETWINGKDAINMGFADNFLPADEIEQEVVKNELPKSIEAANILDRTLARANMPRSERRKLLQDYKGDKRDAVTVDTHDAVMNLLENALKDIKARKGN